MAIDNNSLCYLFDPIFQVENIRGIPIVGGHIEVFIAGTDQKYITWQNFDGARNPFKIPLNNDGRATILVEPNYTYDAYIYDSFNNMVCSRLNIRPVVGGDIVVSGITQVWHDESLSGDGTLQSPLTVVSAGKVYSGIEPIVVNNDVNRISANHVALGLQEPLFFVQDDENACIIGCSAQTEIPEGTMNESAFSYDDSSNITAYNGSAFKTGDEFPESATEAINVVTANSAKWNSAYLPKGASNYIGLYSLAQGLANSAEDYSLAQGGYNTAGGHSLAQGEYNSAEDHSLAQGIWNSARNSSIAQGDHTRANNHSQAFGQDTIATNHGMAIGQHNLTENAAFVIGNGTNSTNRSDAFIIDHSGNVSSQGDISASGISLTSFYTDYQTNSANFVTALPEDLVYTGDLNDYAKKDFVNDSIDSATSALLPTSSFSSVSGDFITALPSDLVYTADITGLATTAQLSEKLDSTAFSTVSGEFLTAVDLTPYQTTAGMTAYQPSGDYLTTADSAQFITALPADLVYTADIQDMATTGDLTAYAQNSALADKLDTSAFSSVSGDYLVGSNVSGFVITATGDGFYNGMTVAISQDEPFAGMYLSKSDINGSKQIYIDTEGIMFYSAGEFSTSEYIDAGNIATLKTLSSSKQDNLTFSYTTANEISAINSSAIAGGTGGSFPSSANEACEVVTANSANWNSTYNTVTANSADWSVSEEISGINGIKISESADKVIIEVSASYATEDWVTGQGYITGINYNTGSI